MRKDYFIHLNDRKEISVQVLDEHGTPVNLSNNVVNFATALEYNPNVIETLSSSNTAQLVITNAANGNITVHLHCSANVGYKSGAHHYQIQVVDVSANTAQVYNEGRMFIEPSLFI